MSRSTWPPAFRIFFSAPFVTGNLTIKEIVSSPSPKIFTPYVFASSLTTMLFSTKALMSTTLSFLRRFKTLTLIPIGFFLNTLFLPFPLWKGSLLIRGSPPPSK